MSRAFREDSSAPGSDTFISRILFFLAASKAIKVDSLTVLCGGRKISSGSLSRCCLAKLPQALHRCACVCNSYFLKSSPLLPELTSLLHIGHSQHLKQPWDASFSLSWDVTKAKFYLKPTSLLERPQ